MSYSTPTILLVLALALFSAVSAQQVSTVAYADAGCAGATNGTQVIACSGACTAEDTYYTTCELNAAGTQYTINTFAADTCTTSTSTVVLDCGCNDLADGTSSMATCTATTPTPTPSTSAAAVSIASAGLIAVVLAASLL
eukprot:TRINITY_DN1473_c0_g1_i2.p1 TRINITY_DN1473_c0_g1~~TRINITY_DN1473_c0_g1_i2.p1  ORF type:complete len:149 (-),score=45.66 TRINITY_DN1473_c0_g1_i2:85-504(-)